MKTILAVAALLLTGTAAWADEQYVLLGSWSNVETKDGVVLKLRPGDWVPYVGKNNTGSCILFSIAGTNGSIPWHDAKLSPATPEIRTAFKGVVDRLDADYKTAIAKREAARERAAIAAQTRAEQQAIANEERERTRFLNELRDIREQLEILNRTRR